MAQKRIKIGLDFDVQYNGIRQLQNELKNITHLKATNQQLIDPKETQKLDEAKAAAQQLQTMLNTSYNVKLNSLDVTKFQQELAKSGTSLHDYQLKLRRLGPEGQQAFRHLTTEIATANTQLRKTDSLLDNLSTTMINAAKWSIAYGAIHKIAEGVQEAYTFTKDLDESLNNIRIVTGKSADDMARFAKQANTAAAALGKTTKDYTNASLIFYQQGLSDKEVAARTSVTMKAANVTGQSAQEVSQELTAIWNGYKVSAQEAEAYIDKVAAVAASTASNLQELSEGMSKVASAANTMGVDIDELNAQLSTIISVTRQDAATAGTALKTIYARMTDIKSGLDTETTLGEYTSKMASFGIQVLDAKGELRDVGDVMEEIGSKWDTFTKTQQVALAQAMAGTRQYNNLMALFGNWDMYTKSLETSQNAAGTLQKQNETYLESMEAKLNQLTAAKEKMYQGLFDSGMFTNGLTVLTKLTEGVAGFLDRLGGIVPLLTGIGGALMMFAHAQIGNAFAEIAINSNNAKLNIEAAKNQVELLKSAEYSSQAGIEQMDKAAQELKLTLAELAQQKLITPEELEESKQVLLTITQTTDKYQQLLDLRKKGTAYTTNVAGLENNKNLFANIENSLYGNNKDVNSQVTEKVKTIISETKADIDDLLPRLQQLKQDFGNDVPTELSKTIDAFSQLRIAEQAVEDSASESFSVKLKPEEIKTRYQEIADSVTSSITNITSVNQQAGDEINSKWEEAAIRLNEVINNESINGVEKIDRLNQVMRQFGIDVKQVTGSSTDAFQAFVNALSGQSTQTQAEFDRLKAKISTVEAEIRAQSQSITMMASRVMMLSSAVSQVSNVFETWADSSKSVGDKLKTLGQSLVTIIPLLAYSGVLSKITTAGKTKELAALKIEEASLKKNSKEKKKNNLVTEEGIVVEGQDFDATIQDAGAKKIGAGAERELTREKNKGVKAAFASIGASLKSGWAALTSGAQAKIGAIGFKELGNKAATAALKMAPLVGIALAVGAAIAAIALIVKLTSDNLHQQEERTKGVTEALESAKNKQKELNDEYDRFKESINAYREAQAEIEELVTGTEEWTKAVEKNNDKVFELIDAYKELAQYIDWDKYNQTGVLSFNEGGIAAVEAAQKSALNQAQLNTAAAQMQAGQNENLATAQTIASQGGYKKGERIASNIVSGAEGTVVGGVAGLGAGTAVGLGTAGAFALGAIATGASVGAAGFGVGAIVGAVIGAIVGIVGGAIIAATGNDVKLIHDHGREVQEAMEALAKTENARAELMNKNATELARTLGTTEETAQYLKDNYKEVVESISKLKTTLATNKAWGIAAANAYNQESGGLDYKDASAGIKNIVDQSLGQYLTDVMESTDLSKIKVNTEDFKNFALANDYYSWDENSKRAYTKDGEGNIKYIELKDLKPEIQAWKAAQDALKEGGKTSNAKILGQFGYLSSKNQSILAEFAGGQKKVNLDNLSQKTLKNFRDSLEALQKQGKVTAQTFEALGYVADKDADAMGHFFGALKLAEDNYEQGLQDILSVIKDETKQGQFKTIQNILGNTDVSLQSQKNLAKAINKLDSNDISTFTTFLQSYQSSPEQLNAISQAFATVEWTDFDGLDQLRKKLVALGIDLTNAELSDTINEIGLSFQKANSDIEKWNISKINATNTAITTTIDSIKTLGDVLDAEVWKNLPEKVQELFVKTAKGYELMASKLSAQIAAQEAYNDITFPEFEDAVNKAIEKEDAKKTAIATNKETDASNPEAQQGRQLFYNAFNQESQYRGTSYFKILRDATLDFIGFSATKQSLSRRQDANTPKVQQTISTYDYGINERKKLLNGFIANYTVAKETGVATKEMNDLYNLIAPLLDEYVSFDLDLQHTAEEDLANITKNAELYNNELRHLLEDPFSLWNPYMVLDGNGEKINPLLDETYRRVISEEGLASLFAVLNSPYATKDQIDTAEEILNLVSSEDYYKDAIQQTDENGNLIFDKNGNPIYNKSIQKIDENGNFVFDEEGNPIFYTQEELAQYIDQIKEKRKLRTYVEEYTKYNEQIIRGEAEETNINDILNERSKILDKLQKQQNNLVMSNEHYLQNLEKQTEQIEAQVSVLKQKNKFLQITQKDIINAEFQKELVGFKTYNEGKLTDSLFADITNLFTDINTDNYEQKMSILWGALQNSGLYQEDSSAMLEQYNRFVEIANKEISRQEVIIENESTLLDKYAEAAKHAVEIIRADVSRYSGTEEWQNGVLPVTKNQENSIKLQKEANSLLQKIAEYNNSYIGKMKAYTTAIDLAITETKMYGGATNRELTRAQELMRQPWLTEEESAELQVLQTQIATDAKSTMSALDEMYQNIQKLETLRLELGEKINEQYETQIKNAETYITVLNHQIKLNKLIFGEKAYAKFSTNYAEIAAQKQIEVDNNRAKYDTAVETYNQLLLQKEKAGLNDDVLQKALNDVIETGKATLTSIEAVIEAAKNEFTNAIMEGFDKVAGEGSIAAAERGLDEFNWEYSFDQNYLSGLQRELSLINLDIKFHKAINSYSGNEAAQKRIIALRQQENELLAKKELLTKNDITLSEKRLALEKARIDLENAQNDTSKMRLVRGANGEYTYQYVSDQNNVLDKLSAFNQAQMDLDSQRKTNLKAVADQVTSLIELFNKLSMAETKAERDAIWERIVKQISALQNSVAGLDISALPQGLQDFIVAWTTQGQSSLEELELRCQNIANNYDTVKTTMKTASEELTDAENGINAYLVVSNDLASKLLEVLNKEKEALDNPTDGLIVKIGNLKSEFDKMLAAAEAMLSRVKDMYNTGVPSTKTPNQVLAEASEYIYKNLNTFAKYSTDEWLNQDSKLKSIVGNYWNDIKDQLKDNFLNKLIESAQKHVDTNELTEASKDSWLDSDDEFNKIVGIYWDDIKNSLQGKLLSLDKLTKQVGNEMAKRVNDIIASAYKDNMVSKEDMNYITALKDTANQTYIEQYISATLPGVASIQEFLDTIKIYGAPVQKTGGKMLSYDYENYNF